MDHRTHSPPPPDPEYTEEFRKLEAAFGQLHVLHGRMRLARAMAAGAAQHRCAINVSDLDAALEAYRASAHRIAQRLSGSRGETTNVLTRAGGSPQVMPAVPPAGGPMGVARRTRNRRRRP